jgi:hypothetical protein
MGNLFNVAFVLLGIAGIFLIYYMYKTIISIGSERKKEKEYKAYLKKSMEEDYFVDPDTGRKFTLEEAEAGIDFGLQNTVRPDEEIEKQFFDENHREVAFVKNNLLKHKYTAIEKAGLNDPVYLYGKKSTNTILGVFTRGNGRYALVAHVEFRFQRSNIKEDKIVLAFQVKQHMGHVLIWETDMLAKLENMIDGSQKISPGGKYTVNIPGDNKKGVFDTNNNVLDSMKGANEEIIDKITEVLEQYGKCECEIIGETIYVKSILAASRTELERMMEMEAHLFTRLQDYLTA